MSGRAPRAMILAAGLGTRLRPLTEDTPKPLVLVGGHPLIAYGLGLLRANGIRDVVVNVHHHRERIMRELGDGARYGVRIRYSIEPELLDSGGGIRNAARLFGAEPIVVLNSDIICEVPIRDVLRFHRETRALVTLVMRDAPDAARYGLFGIDGAGRIRRFLGEEEPRREESREPADPLRDRMFASVQILDPRAIAEMPEGRPFSTMREFYPALFRSGERLFGYLYDGRWLTADTPADLERAEQELHAEGLPDCMLGSPARPSR